MIQMVASSSALLGLSVLPFTQSTKPFERTFKNGVLSVHFTQLRNRSFGKDVSQENLNTNRSKLTQVKASKKISTEMFELSSQDPTTVLGVSSFATKDEIKKAYRSRVLQYHPDVCKGSLCALNFQQVAEAYEILMERSSKSKQSGDEQFDDVESLMGVGDGNWEEWEEWMGYDGAGSYDYSNHINRNII